MAFCFEKKETVSKAVRRLGCERVEDARECLRRGGHLEGIHEARKEIKKLRALLRLVRDHIGTGVYRANTKALRRAAEHLAGVRDAHVRLNAFEELVRHFRRKLPKRPFPEIKKALRKNCRDETRRFLQGNSVATVDRIFRRLRKDLGCLKTGGGGWSVIGPGLRESYCRGQEAGELVKAEPTSENFHEWRKRIKDLWYHLRLLCPIWPEGVGATADELETLSEYIGDDHDLVMLREFAANQSRKAAKVDELIELACLRQKELRAAAVKQGTRFYSEKPERFCRRFRRYWKIWRIEK